MTVITHALSHSVRERTAESRIVSGDFLNDDTPANSG